MEMLAQIVLQGVVLVQVRLTVQAAKADIIKMAVLAAHVIQGVKLAPELVLHAPDLQVFRVQAAWTDII